jgi:hypothetical protein
MDQYMKILIAHLDLEWKCVWNTWYRFLTLALLKNFMYWFLHLCTCGNGKHSASTLEMCGTMCTID